MFGRGWEPGQATIVAVQFVATGRNTSGSRAEFVADVRTEGAAAPFRATFKEPLHSLNFRTPVVGQTVRVEFDAKRGEVRFDTSDPTVRNDVVAERSQERFDAFASAPPGTAVPREAPEPAVPSTLGDMSETVGDLSAASAGISAAAARMSAATTDAADTIAAIQRARAAGDLAEVERLKAEFQRQTAERKKALGHD